MMVVLLQFSSSNAILRVVDTVCYNGIIKK